MEACAEEIQQEPRVLEADAETAATAQQMHHSPGPTEAATETEPTEVAPEVMAAAEVVHHCLRELWPRVDCRRLAEELGLPAAGAAAALQVAAEDGPRVGLACTLDWLICGVPAGDGASTPAAGTHRQLLLVPAQDLSDEMAALRPGAHAEVHSARLVGLPPRDAGTLAWRADLEACWAAFCGRPPGPDGPALSATPWDGTGAGAPGRSGQGPFVVGGVVDLDGED